MADQIQTVDREIEVLFNNLDEAGILGCIDVIVLADHGMAPAPTGEKFLILNEYVPNISKDARIYDGVFPSIRPYLDTEGSIGFFTSNFMSHKAIKFFSD